jgi:hypothetical protein
VDWGRFWDNFRSGIGTGFLVMAGLIVVFVIYYLTIGSRKSRRIQVAKWRARKLLETGEMPDDRTSEYIYLMLRQVPDDPEAVALLQGLKGLKTKGETATKG